MPKLKITPILICFLLLFNASRAQLILEEEILKIESVDSTHFYIDNGRRLIVKKVEEGRNDELMEVIRYLNQRVDSSMQLLFYQSEKQLIGLIANDFDYFFEATKSYNNQGNKFLPPNDNLYIVCTKEFRNNQEQWKTWYENLNLFEEKKQVIRIFLGFVGVFNNQAENHTVSNRFRKKYPNSQYLNFVNSIRNHFFSNYGEYSMGFGSINFNGSLANVMNNGKILHFEYGWLSNKLYFNMYLTNILQSTLVNTLYTEYEDHVYQLNGGSPLNTWIVGGKIGWVILENYRFKIYPYLNICSLSNDAKDISIDDGLLNLNVNMGLGGGLNADVALLKWKPKGHKIHKEIGVRSNLNYVQFLSNSGIFSGHTLSGTIGLYYRFPDNYWF